MKEKVELKIVFIRSQGEKSPEEIVDELVKEAIKKVLSPYENISFNVEE